MKDLSKLEKRLTAQLYEGLLTEEGWSDALRTIATMTKSPEAAVIVQDTHRQVLAVSETFGMPEEVLEIYNAHYHQLDDARPFLPSIPWGDWYLDRRHFGEQSMQRSEFYQDFLAPSDISTILANRLLTTDGQEAYLSLHRRPGQPHYTDDEIASFTAFIPHVQQAVRIRLHLQRLAERAGLASVALDCMRVPLMVLDEHGRMLLANSEADALMRRQPLLTMRQGCLQPQGLRIGQFAQLLRSACGLGCSAVAGGALIANTQGQPALQLLVLPLPARLQSFNSWARPLALVVLHDPSQPQNAQQYLLQQLYGLTPAETRVTLALIQGDTPAQAARRLGVSVGTVRTQMKAVFAKIGVSRQTDLMRLLTTLRVVG